MQGPAAHFVLPCAPLGPRTQVWNRGNPRSVRDLAPLNYVAAMVTYTNAPLTLALTVGAWWWGLIQGLQAVRITYLNLNLLSTHKAFPEPTFYMLAVTASVPRGMLCF